MKKAFSFFLFIIAGFTVLGQNDSEPDYLRFPTIPRFTLIGVDSMELTQNNLVKGEKTLIIYFSPDCNHCRLLTESILTNIHKLGNVQLVFTSYAPIEKIKEFCNENNFKNYNNIKLGRDINFFFIPFYNIKKIPFIAIYNENGQLLKVFGNGALIEELIENVK